MNRENAAIYLHAAKHTQRRKSFGYPGACEAIQWAATGSYKGCVYSRHRLTAAYNRLFRPRHPIDTVYWGEAWPDPKACRFLSLCFAAAMAEAGDI